VSEENEKFVYFVNSRRNSGRNNVEFRPRQVSREEWEASWLSWWNRNEARRRKNTREESGR